MNKTIRIIASAALLAATLPAGTALAEDNPFAISLAGGGGRGARLPASADGKLIYEHICQGCHMAGGKGAEIKPSKYPALAGNPKLAARGYPAMMVISGLGAMPAFGSMLNDTQVAAVVNYLRSSFGNNYQDAITLPEVAAMRPVVQQAPTELRGR